MSIRWKLLALVFGVMGILAGIAITATVSGNRKLIELQSRQIAKSVATQVTAERKHYTSAVLGPLSLSQFTPRPEGGHTPDEKKVPLPAEFIRMIADSVSAETGEIYRYKLVSRWNINQASGLEDDFLVQAFDKLLEQEANAKAAGSLSDTTPYTGWEPVHQIFRQGGRRVLRYVEADPATAMACVTCHNELEQRENIAALRASANQDRGHKFELNDLMGAIVVEVDLEEAILQSLLNLRAIIALSIMGAVLVGLVAFWRSEVFVAPILELSRAAKAIAAGDMANRANVHTGDELGSLGKTFNEMADRIEEGTRELHRLNAEREAIRQERADELRDANRKLETRNQELAKSLELVHHLSGLLPICAECKKVRNDEGHWEKIERYIAARSEAEFTHSICPDCTQKLYPEFVDPDSLRA